MLIRPVYYDFMALKMTIQIQECYIFSFLFLLKNCRHLKVLDPHHLGCSNDYTLCFSAEIRMIMCTHVNPVFTIQNGAQEVLILHDHLIMVK